MSNAGRIVAGVAKHWKFSGALGRVALTVGAPATAAAISLIWIGTTIPGAIAPTAIVGIVGAIRYAMLGYAERHPDSVLEGSELIQFHGMIQTKGHAPLPAANPVETLPSTPLIELLDNAVDASPAGKALVLEQPEAHDDH